jgi:hypothetical protein
MTEIEVKATTENGLSQVINQVMNVITAILLKGEFESLKEWQYRYEFDLKMKVYHLLPPTNNFKLYVVSETQTSKRLKFVFRYDHEDLSISQSIANVLQSTFPLNVTKIN